MAFDLDVFDMLDANQNMEIDAAELESYEISNESTYGMTDTDHSLLMDNLDASLPDSPLYSMNSDVSSAMLDQYEADYQISGAENDFIDGFLQEEGVVDLDYAADGEIEQIDTINDHLEGTAEPASGVYYESNTVDMPDGSTIEGVFPVFDSAYNAVIPPEDYLSSSYAHEQIANEQLATAAQDPDVQGQFDAMQLEQISDGETPDGYTWHHHEVPGQMELVETETHDLARHSGGMSLWGKGY